MGPEGHLGQSCQGEMDDPDHGLCVAVPLLLPSPFHSPKVSEVNCLLCWLQTYQPSPEPCAKGAPLFTTWPVPAPMLTWHKHRRRLLEDSPDPQDFQDSAAQTLLPGGKKQVCVSGAVVWEVLAPSWK